MHEVSIARDLLERIEGNLGSDRARVVRIAIDVGSAAGIVMESLRFAFEVVARGSRAEGAELSMTTMPARSRCSRCATPFEFEGMIGNCPSCGCLGGELLSGNEIILRTIEVADV
jgi:hydrogenase nickel incorporation protein HypA/HybF